MSKKKKTPKVPEEKYRHPDYTTGRPTEYRPEYCDKIIEFMSEGKSIVQFAASLKVAESTIYEWAKVNPEFSKAKNIAITASEAWNEQFLMDNIINWSETIKNGKESTTTSRSINASVAIYRMKCRFRKNWTEVQKIKHYTEDKEQVQTIKIAYEPKKKRGPA